MQKRNRHNINPSRPKMPTWQRKVMLEFGEPRFTIPHKSTENLWQDCPRHLEVVEEKKNANANPYELLYAKQLLEFMETSKMIGIYHTHTMETPQARKVRFKKQGRDCIVRVDIIF
jgi:hypothetical protein